MGATNSTLNYQLSQFISTDKPAWLQDYNGDMEKIDAGINTAKVAADTAQNTANSAVSSIGTVSSDISALQTDVLAHTNDITDLQGDVNTIESLIGNGTPTAGDHTLIGAINTNTNDITTASSTVTELTKHTLGTAVDLKNYSVNNKYIAPSDGYLVVGCAGTAGDFTYGYANGVQLVGISAPSSASLTGFDNASVFVKKGMELYGNSNDFTKNGAYIRFIPLI